MSEKNVTCLDCENQFNVKVTESEIECPDCGSEFRIMSEPE